MTEILSRRSFLKLAGEFTISQALAGKLDRVYAANQISASFSKLVSTEKPLVSAIYWGGWFPGSRWSNYIVDQRWADRWPYYAELNPKSRQAIINGDRQEVVDQAIIDASAAGISSFAFPFYERHSPIFNQYNNSLDHFLNSSLLLAFKFSLILQGSHLVNEENQPEFSQEIIELMKNPRYQTTPNGRPAIYLYDVQNLISKFGSVEITREQINKFKDQATRNGLAEPFLIILDGDESAIQLGADGIGSYSATGNGEEKEYPFESLMQANQDRWEVLAAKGLEVVLPISSGWDPRPRFADPEFGHIYRNKPWYKSFLPEQFTKHLTNAFNWQKTHPKCSQFMMSLVYAYDEFDEGGILARSYHHGLNSLNSLKLALDRI